MKVAVIADVHANLVALEAVLVDAGRVDEVWSLGDAVGYGPDPNECISLLREVARLSIPGNHDYAAMGTISTDDFNSEARQAAEWTGTVLSEASRAYLASLPETIVEGPATLAHGSPRSPIWEYVLSVPQAEELFAHFQTQYCLIGHSHIPLAFALPMPGVAPPKPWPPPQEPLDLAGRRWLLNPGSVGQPRDGDRRAAYGILDTETASFVYRRVEYDIAETQQRMRRAGLPERLILRLDSGR